MTLVGGSFPAATRDHAPVIYGQPLAYRRPSLRPKTSLAEIAQRIDDAKRKLDEIAEVVRKR